MNHPAQAPDAHARFAIRGTAPIGTAQEPWHTAPKIHCDFIPVNEIRHGGSEKGHNWRLRHHDGSLAARVARRRRGSTQEMEQELTEKTEIPIMSSVRSVASCSQSVHFLGCGLAVVPRGPSPQERLDPFSILNSQLCGL